MGLKNGNKLYAALGLTLVGFITVSVTFIVLYLEERDRNNATPVTAPPFPSSIPPLPSTTVSPPPAASSQAPASEICHTEGCILAARTIALSMNRSVEPCDNFYEFACGNWAKNQAIPPGKLYWTAYDMLQRDLDAALHEILSEEANSSTASTATEKAKEYYKLCTDEVALEDPENFEALLRHVGEIFPEFKDFSFTSIPSIKATAQALIRARRYGISLIILGGTGPDENVPGATMIQFIQPQFGVNINPYLKSDDVNVKLDAYEELVRDFLLLFARKGRFTLSAEEATKLAEQFVTFEKTLFNHHKADPRMHARRQPKNQMTLQSVAEMYTSSIGLETGDLIEFFAGAWANVNASLKLNPGTVVNVQSLEYYEGLTGGLKDYIQTTAGRAFYAHYVLYQVAYAYVDRLGSDFRAITQKYLAATQGITAWKPRPDFCAKMIIQELPDPVGSLYVQRHFQQSTKQKLEKMVDYLFGSLKRLINNAEWMTNATKIHALAKADLLKVQIGYPNYFDNDPELLDRIYSEFNVSSGSYLEATITNQRTGAKLEGDSFVNGFAEDLWLLSAAMVNAYYQPNLATIAFPAGILQAPFLSEDYFEYWNYGAIGTIIGHEMTHGFDNFGSQFDGYGQLINWWDQQSAAGFQERLQGLREQYKKYYFMDIQQGVGTLGEDVADNGALKEAFLAYRDYVAKERSGVPEPVLPELGFTAEQLFFVSNAQAYCASYTRTGAQLLTTYDTHSLNPFRVIGPMQNYDEFSTAFNCHPGSYMNPLPKQGVW